MAKLATAELVSAIQKFKLAEVDAKAHIWSEEGTGGLELTQQELHAFILWVRESDYDLERGPVNLLCQGYGSYNCEESHNETGGMCDCFIGLTLEDFEGEDEFEVDIAPWWSNFRLMHNPEF